jgi:menaquinone-dependent protoporphyrinogen oxidase
MPRIAVIYHTMDGQTHKIADRIAEIARGDGADVDIFPVSGAPDSLDGYDSVVIGGPIHMAHHHKDLLSFIRAHAAELAARPSAFYSVSLSAGGDEQQQANAHGVVDSFLEQSRWEPDIVALFGGALVYTRYGFFKRQLMKFIVRREGGPTDTSQDYEFTDWDAVDHFAHDVVAHATGAAA